MPTTATVTRTAAQHAEALVQLLEATGLRCGPLVAGEVTVELDAACGYCRHPVPHGVGERHHLAAGVVTLPPSELDDGLCSPGCHQGSHDETCVAYDLAYLPLHVATCVCGYASHPEASVEDALDSLGQHVVESSAW